MKYKLLTIALLFCSSLFAQESADYNQKQSKESLAYHEARTKISVPPYGIVKVRAKIAKITSDTENLKLSAKEYLSLSLKEKFTYCMIHAEDYDQNCDPVLPVIDEEKKIMASLENPFPEFAWSERQTAFLNKNRDSVMALVKASVLRSKRMGLNYKLAINEINGWEMIPFIIQTFKADHKDLDLLTLLMKLMINNNYAPFMQSETHRKLYGNEANDRSYIKFNKANEDLMLSRANDFYLKMKKG
ncbi:hypothetical protein [Pedobacter metabolipauper]|uniref:DUF4476 domain-containing protein n=1 Tax=Pedobacter metabolipauper TaxID=425513 RepID=A0A4R6SVD3_9SPHI|nr:hypothetical protein [Pedobacter metabolipauper]TDQ08409.1 hypothetical protein ATK78_2922 [Pedobacter metabolipauper]